MKETQMNQNNEYDIGASDSILLIVSLIGFLLIGIALFHFLLPKRGVPSLLDEDVNQEGEGDEKELVGGNRAQRKAHARRRAERQREQRRRQMELEAENEEQQNEQNLREHILQQGRRREGEGGEGEEDENEEDSQSNNNHMSKKETKKAIKRAEKQRYRRMEEERRAEIRKKKEAEDAAYLERRALERKEELQLKLKEEQDVNVREAKELKEYNKWKAMFVLEGSSNSTSALAVDDCINNNDDKYWENVIEFIKQKKIVQVDSVAQKFGLQTEDVMRKLNKMSDLVFDQNSGTFVYMSEELMESLKRYIKEKGSVTSDDLANKIKVLVTST